LPAQVGVSEELSQYDLIMSAATYANRGFVGVLLSDIVSPQDAFSDPYLALDLFQEQGDTVHYVEVLQAMQEGFPDAFDNAPYSCQ